MTQEQMNARFEVINAQEPEELTPEEEASLADAEAMDDGTWVSYEELRSELLATDKAQLAKLLKDCTAEEMARLEDELDLIAYEKAMAEYRANPVTYTMEEMKKELGLDD